MKTPSTHKHFAIGAIAGLIVSVVAVGHQSIATLAGQTQFMTLDLQSPTLITGSCPDGSAPNIKSHLNDNNEYYLQLSCLTQSTARTATSTVNVGISQPVEVGFQAQQPAQWDGGAGTAFSAPSGGAGGAFSAPGTPNGGAGTAFSAPSGTTQVIPTPVAGVPTVSAPPSEATVNISGSVGAGVAVPQPVSGPTFETAGGGTDGSSPIPFPEGSPVTVEGATYPGPTTLSPVPNNAVESNDVGSIDFTALGESYVNSAGNTSTTFPMPVVDTYPTVLETGTQPNSLSEPQETSIWGAIGSFINAIGSGIGTGIENLNVWSDETYTPPVDTGWSSTVPGGNGTTTVDVNGDYNITTIYPGPGDLTDLVCTSPNDPDCDEDWEFVSVGSAESPTALNCGDFTDNDGNNLRDYQEDACIEICNNGSDDNADNKIDLADPDCSGFPVTPVSTLIDPAINTTNTIIITPITTPLPTLIPGL